jgi:hypothetical protein
MTWEGEYLRAQYLESRETPFEIVLPRNVQSTMKIDLPAGYQLAGIERCNGAGQTKFVSWTSRAWQTGKTVNIEYKGRMSAGSHPATDYQQFCSDTSDSLSALKTPVTLQQSAVQTAGRGASSRSAR